MEAMRRVSIDDDVKKLQATIGTMPFATRSRVRRKDFFFLFLFFSRRSSWQLVRAEVNELFEESWS